MSNGQHSNDGHYQAAFNRNSINHLLLSRHLETGVSATFGTPGRDLSNSEEPEAMHLTKLGAHTRWSQPISTVTNGGPRAWAPISLWATRAWILSELCAH